jgi:hypothetical protein
MNDNWNQITFNTIRGMEPKDWDQKNRLEHPEWFDEHGTYKVQPRSEPSPHLLDLSIRFTA